MKTDVYEIVTKLIGPIEPAGATHLDSERLENLESMIDLVERLRHDIVMVGRHKGRGEHSMNKAGERANAFLDDIKKQVCIN